MIERRNAPNDPDTFYALAKYSLIGQAPDRETHPRLLKDGFWRQRQVDVVASFFNMPSGSPDAGLGTRGHLRFPLTRQAAGCRRSVRLLAVLLEQFIGDGQADVCAATEG